MVRQKDESGRKEKGEEEKEKKEEEKEKRAEVRNTSSQTYGRGGSFRRQKRERCGLFEKSRISQIS